MTDLNIAFNLLKPETYKNLKLDNNNEKFEVFPIFNCWKCQRNDFIMTTNDGNRTQICLKCNTKILHNGLKTY